MELIEFEKGVHAGLRHRRRPYWLQNISLPRPPQGQCAVLPGRTPRPHCETHSDKLDNEQENCPSETTVKGASAPEAHGGLGPPPPSSAPEKQGGQILAQQAPSSKVKIVGSENMGQDVDQVDVESDTDWS